MHDLYETLKKRVQCNTNTQKIFFINSSNFSSIKRLEKGSQEMKRRSLLPILLGYVCKTRSIQIAMFFELKKKSTFRIKN